MIRILHTADVHLGRRFPSLRDRGREYRNQLLDTFERVLQLAVNENVSLVLIAGDLFDTNRVHGVTVGKVLSAFRKLEERSIRVCILPGGHDAFTEDSIYRFVHFPSNVTVLTTERTHVTFDDLDLTVYGRAFDDKLVGENPLRSLSLDRESGIHIGMAHCSIKRAGMIETDSMVLDRGEIASSGLDYLALGHWHSFQDHSQGSTVAYYCGSPEPIDMDQKGSGSVAMVNIHAKGDVKVDRVRVGTKVFDAMSIDIGVATSVEQIVSAIEAKADAHLVLRVTLEGLRSIDCDTNAEEIEDALCDRFFSLQVLDRSHPALREIESEDLPEETVVGKFVKIARERIAQADNKKDEALYREALGLGFALLHGKSEIIE